MNLNNICIPEDQTILAALKKLNLIRDVSRLILFVNDGKERIVGTLTDGDIRRSLSLHADLNKKVGAICNRNFIFESSVKDFIDLSNFRKRDITILPLLDNEGRLRRVVDLVKTKAVLPLECMIMAGGRGKRLSPLTDNIPKPMLPLGDKPIIEYNIDRLISYGIKKIYISVKYLGNQIQEFFGDGSKKGIEIEYIWETEALGTAGALALVDEFKTDKVLLMNSDLFTNVDFEDLYLDMVKNDSDMVVASTEYKVDIPYAVFETDGGKVVNFQEKPSYIYQSNAGIYILNKNLIDRIPKNQFYDITELMETIVSEEGKINFSPIRGYWIDIGKPVDYKQALDFVKHLE